MKSRLINAIAPAAAAGALALLAGCTTPQQGGSSNYSVTALKPHNPEAVRVKVSLSKQIVYVFEGSKPLLVAATNVGIPGKSTPTGNFRIESKQAGKRSGTYGFWVKGDEAVPGESSKSTLPGGHYVGYPMAFWCEFAPSYGFHQGYVWPVPRTHGCLRLHHNVAPKFFALVHVGTPVNIAETQPEDATLGETAQHPTDYNDPDPPAAFMASPKVFESPPGGGLVPY